MQIHVPVPTESSQAGLLLLSFALVQGKAKESLGLLDFSFARLQLRRCVSTGEGCQMSSCQRKHALSQGHTKNLHELVGMQVDNLDADLETDNFPHLPVQFQHVQESMVANIHKIFKPPTSSKSSQDAASEVKTKKLQDSSNRAFAELARQ